MKKIEDLKKPSNLVIAIIFSIVLFYLINFLLFPSPFTPVQPYTGNFSQLINYFTGSGGLTDLVKIVKMKYKGVMYPPLYFLNLLVPVYVFGRNWVLMLVTVHTFYLLMLLTFTYLLGKELKDEKTGLIAVILVSLYPANWIYYRQVIIEYPLLGVAAMSAYFLHRSECFNNLNWSILFAFSCAWGMWIKDIFGAFIIGPVLYGFYKATMNSGKSRGIQPVLNFLAFATTFYVVIHPYYFEGLFKPSAFNTFEMKRPVDISWFSFENIKPLLYGILEGQFGIVFFVVFIAGIYDFVTSMKFQQNTGAGSNGSDPRVILLLWIIVPNLIMLFVILLVSHMTNVRSLMPQVSMVAIISAFSLRRVIDKKLGLLIFVMLIGFGVFRYYRVTYSNTLFDDNVFDNVFSRSQVSSFDRVKLEVIDEIKEMRIRGINKNSFVLSTINNVFIDYRTFLWFNGVEITEVKDIYPPGALNDYLKEPAVWFKMFFKILDNSDFLIVFSNNNQPLDLYDFETVKDMFSFDPKIIRATNWEMYKEAVSQKMNNFKARQIPPMSPDAKFELYIKNK